MRASCHCGAVVIETDRKPRGVYYEAIGKDPDSRFAINGRCFAPEELADVPLRHFDGADTWKYLD